MLSGPISLSIPGVSNVMDTIDQQKAKFLSVPARVRTALDKLSRIGRMMGTDAGTITTAANQQILTAKNNLEGIQLRWNSASSDYQQLDSLRQGNVSAVSLDTITLAATLATNAAFIMGNADKYIAAVDQIAKTYLTPAQQKQLDVAVTGGTNVAAITAGVSLPILLGLAALWLMLRRRR